MRQHDGHTSLQLEAMLVQFSAKVWREAEGGIMPLHYGKIFAIIAILTIVAFVLWQLWIGLFAGETFDERTAPPHAELPLMEAAPA
jgi:hypothetical protein